MALPGDLTPQEREGYREQFEQGKACPHCGGLHLRACPRVRRLVFRGTGSETAIAEVEFWPAGRWPDDGIIWPEDAYEDAEEAGNGQEADQGPALHGAAE